MPIRNPFRRAEHVEEVPAGVLDSGFSTTPVLGAQPGQIKDPIEYKLSEISDDGVYLPPSPHQEKPNFWHSKSSASTVSSNHRSLLSENEPFNISRQSFDSYRRSFDISARSPIQKCGSETYPRQSLDARRSRATPRSSMQQSRHGEDQDHPAEEHFEDVALDDESQRQAQKKRGLFSRFTDSTDHSEKSEDRPTPFHHFSLTGRKRAESGGGAEMKPMTKLSADLPTRTR